MIRRLFLMTSILACGAFASQAGAYGLDPSGGVDEHPAKLAAYRIARQFPVGTPLNHAATASGGKELALIERGAAAAIRRRDRTGLVAALEASRRTSHWLDARSTYRSRLRE